MKKFQNIPAWSNYIKSPFNPAISRHQFSSKSKIKCRRQSFLLCNRLMHLKSRACKKVKKGHPSWRLKWKSDFNVPRSNFFGWTIKIPSCRLTKLRQKFTGTFVIVMKVKGCAGILNPLFAVCQHRSCRDFMTSLGAIKPLAITTLRLSWSATRCGNRKLDSNGWFILKLSLRCFVFSRNGGDNKMSFY